MKRIATTLALVGLWSCAADKPAVPPPAPVASAATATTPAPATPPTAAANAPDFRATPPAAEGSVTFVPPKIEDATLENGMRVLFIERHDLPIVSVGVVSDRGATEAKPGVCSFMADALRAGTTSHSQEQLEDEFERIGATFSSGCDNSSTYVGGKVLSAKLPRLVELLSEVVRHPAFAKDEVAREKKRRQTRIDQMKDHPSQLVRRAMYGLLYPKNHPFAHDTLGDAEDVERVTPKDLDAARKATLTPAETSIVVAGDVDRKGLLALLNSRFGDWKEPAPAARRLPELTPPKGAPNVVIIDTPGSPQSSVLLARVGVERHHPDFAKLFVTNHIFGGSFSGRLNMNLREQHAWTYGAHSAFHMWWHGPGPFAMGAEVKTENTADAIAETLRELARMRDENVTEKELHEAITGLSTSLPGEFTSTEEARSAIQEIAVHHLSLDEWATRPSRYAGTTLEDVKRLANEHMKATDLRIVVAGDASKIEAGIRALNLGEVEVRASAKAEEKAKPALKGATKPKAK